VVPHLKVTTFLVSYSCSSAGLALAVSALAIVSPCRVYQRGAKLLVAVRRLEACGLHGAASRSGEGRPLRGFILKVVRGALPARSPYRLREAAMAEVIETCGNCTWFQEDSEAPWFGLCNRLPPDPESNRNRTGLFEGPCEGYKRDSEKPDVVPTP
jgi:hypothetical protein